MNKFLKVFGIVVALVTMCSVCVAACVQLERIDAYLNHGLNVVKDGQVLILKDANGKKLTPITYNDSTYLPVRAIANALGVQVDWDQETQSVLLGGSKVPAHLKPVQQSTTSVNYGTPHYTESDVEMMAKVMYCEARGIASKKEIACIDADKVKGPLTIRRWEQGDKFAPLGMTGKKKVSDYLTDRKFTLFQKERQWVVCSGEDIVWLVNERSDHRYRVTENTRRVLLLSVKVKDGE